MNSEKQWPQQWVWLAPYARMSLDTVSKQSAALEGAVWTEWVITLPLCGGWKNNQDTLHNTIASAVAEEAKLAGWHVRETPEDILVADATAQPAPILTTEIPGDLRKKLIPDIAMGPPEQERPRLYDIKTLGNTQQYMRSPSTVLQQCHVVDERGSQVNHEYQEAARRIDRQLQPDLAPNERGAMESKLRQHGEVKGLAFGFYSEASSDMRDLIRYWVQARAEPSARAMGMDVTQAANWVRRGILYSIGMRVAIGWARLKIKVLNSAVLGRARRPHPRITPIIDSAPEMNYYLPPLPLPLIPVGAVC